VLLRFKWLFKSCKDTNLQVLIKSQQNTLKQEVEKFFLRLLNLVLLFGKKRNCLRVRRNMSLNLRIWRAIIQIVVIIGRINFAKYVKILSSIMLSRLTPYAEEIIGDYQCGFRRNSSSTDRIFCIRQIPEKNWNTKN